jgi:hypothetical protein
MPHDWIAQEYESPDGLGRAWHCSKCQTTLYSLRRPNRNRVFDWLNSSSSKTCEDIQVWQVMSS